MDNEFDSNAEALQATRDLQKKSLDALERIQNQAAETQAIGLETMDQLDQQGQRMDSALNATKELNDQLGKASKLQDRFGFLSMQFANKAAAKSQVKTEEKFRTGKSSKKEKKSKQKNSDDTTSTEAPKFKRRGARPKKGAVQEEKPVSMDDLVSSTTKKSNDLKNEVDRNELFAGAKPKNKPMRAGKRADKRKQQPPVKDTPMTDLERRDLAEIEADDKAVDAGLDILGNQVESLLQISKGMGETVQLQNGKLDDIDKGLTKADNKSKQVNQRAKLFTLNRRQKRKEKNKFETPVSMKANAALAAVTM